MGLGQETREIERKSDSDSPSGINFEYLVNNEYMEWEIILCSNPIFGLEAISQSDRSRGTNC